MSVACGSSKAPSFQEISSKTHLTPQQISNFYYFFKKCSRNNNDFLTHDEFRASLGVFGSKSGTFISNRLFDVISDPKTQKLTFLNYIMFLNLVNFGTIEEKLNHCFKIFDIKSKGYISREDFVTIMYNLCVFFAGLTVSQILITKEDLNIFFRDFTKKIGLEILDLESFKKLIDVNPKFLDFYEIFNNNIQTDITIKITKEQIDKFNQLLEIVDQLKTKIVNSQDKSSTVTLATDSYIDEIMELRKIKENLSKIYLRFNTKNCNSENQRKGSCLVDNEPFKIPCADLQKEEDEDYYHFSDESSFNESESSRYNSENLKTEEKKKQTGTLIPSHEKVNFMSSQDKIKMKFKIIKPFSDIKDPGLISKIQNEGFDITNCLIITNKDNFLSYITQLHQQLSFLFSDLLQNKLRTKRASIRIEQTKNHSFNFGSIVNMPIKRDKESEKGMIHFGNPNLELIINIMMGIKHSVSKIEGLSIPKQVSGSSTLFPIDNDEIYLEMNRYKYEQNNFDKIVECKFYDFAPKIFYNLRHLYGITNYDYLKSLGPENFLGNLIIIKGKTLKELCSSGKSGSFFYFSYDSKYLLKTISEGEFMLFKSMLKDYYLHIYHNKKTLLQRFYGMHICIFNNLKMYFVVMNNVFLTPLKVHYKYDLKGSTYQRISRKKKEIDYSDYDYGVPLKDIDFIDRKEDINLMEYEKKMIVKQSIKDSEFLAAHGINDYSFLIGVYDQNLDNNSMVSQEDLIIFSKSLTSSTSIKARKPFYEQYLGGIRSMSTKKVYFFGIIDIFTLYGSKKKMEHLVKSISQGNGISCKPPIEYSNRFCNFLKKIFNVKIPQGEEDENGIISIDTMSSGGDKYINKSDDEDDN